MENPDIDIGIRKKMLEDTYKEIKKDQDDFLKQKKFDKAEKDTVEAGGGTYTPKNYVPKSQINKAVGGNKKVTSCAVTGMVKLATDVKSPFLSSTDCKFKMIYDDDSATDVCGEGSLKPTVEVVNELFDAIDYCTNKTGSIQEVEADCKDQLCRICLDGNCFEQSFKAPPKMMKKKVDNNTKID